MESDRATLLPVELEILAHRANVAGPDPGRENSLLACEHALTLGFGLEIDLRRDSTGKFYISHDAGRRTSENNLEMYEEMFRFHPELSIAVDIKESGYEGALIELQKSGTFGGIRDFYFDFELLDPAAPFKSLSRLLSLPAGGDTRLATRLSDRGESMQQCLSIKCSRAWVDEFDSFWLRETEIRALHERDRRVYAVSPELHGCSARQRRERWAQFKAWGIDGLCTDYALEARDFFA